MSSRQPRQAGPEQTPHHKVAIPRQERRNESPRWAPTARTNRVSRACLCCRSKKIRCNGAQPTCQNCRESAISCVYASTRKDRLRTATEHNEEMMDFLKDLRPNVPDGDKMRIDEMLGNVSDDVADAASTFRKAQSSESAEVGSNEDLDMNNEDILRSEQSRATGFLGKNSEVQWLRQMDHETKATNGRLANKPYGPPGNSIKASAQRAKALQDRQDQDQAPSLQTSHFSFYLDDETVDMNFPVNSDDLPPFEIADRLLRCYMETVQPSFPILAKKFFVNQFYHYYDALARGAPYRLPRKYQAMLNLVFAIGSVYCHLVESNWQADDRDHLLYHARAWELSIKDPWWISHADLAQTQIAGLLAIYYLAIGHINRAWVLIGMAVRFGFGLGLHIRNEDRTAAVVKKELLSRIWWGLYTLERLLAAMTGRPSVSIEAHCSASLPLPIPCDEIEEARIKALFGDDPRSAHAEELMMTDALPSGVHNIEKTNRDPANTGTYLKCTVKLGQIQQKILSQLYSPSVVSKSWKDVEEIILEINGELEAWAASIPSGFSYLGESNEKTLAYEQSILLLHYRSTNILVNRPCLCRDRRIPNQSQSSSDFNQRMALSCVNSAKDVTASLPDDMENESSRIYELLPWWAAVHYIMQSLTILMLETSYDGVLGSEKAGTISSMKKLVRWLRVLSKNNGMARRAYPIVMNLLQKMVVQTHVDISDLLEEDRAHNLPPPADPSPWHGIDTQPFFTEENLEQHSFQNTCSEYPPVAGYQSVADSSLSPSHGLFSADPQTANLFFTGFDQQNLFSFPDLTTDNFQQNCESSTQTEDTHNSNGEIAYQW